MYKVYQLIDPVNNTIMYIGISKQDLYKRLVQHIYDAYCRTRTFDNKQKWIKELFERGLIPKITLLESTTDKTRERYWVRKVKPLLNMVHSGLSNELYLYVNSGKRKPVYQYGLDGQFLKEWRSALEAATELDIKPENICHCIQGRRKRAGEFMWSEVKLDFVPPYKQDHSSKYKEVHMYTLDGKYLKTYISMAAATPDGFSVKGISRCCTGNRKSYQGFKFSKFKI